MKDIGTGSCQSRPPISQALGTCRGHIRLSGPGTRGWSAGAGRNRGIRGVGLGSAAKVPVKEGSQGSLGVGSQMTQAQR